MENNDIVTTFKEVYSDLLNSGVSPEEATKMLFDNGKKSVLLAEDSIDIMIFYFRAKKLLEDKHIQDVLAQKGQLKGVASISKDIDAIYALQTFVGTMESLAVSSNVGSSDTKTWEEYFKNAEELYVKSMKQNKTGSQQAIFDEIKDNPYDPRVKNYLKTYMSAQVKQDIVYAINTNAKALEMVKGLPFAMGRSKQESYATVVLKYLYADSQISKYIADNAKLEQLNKELQAQNKAYKNSQIKITDIEQAFISVMSNMNPNFSQKISDGLDKIDNTIKSEHETTRTAINSARDVLLSSNDDVRDDLKGLIKNIASSNSKNAKKQISLLNNILAKLDELQNSITENSGDINNISQILINYAEIIGQYNITNRELSDIEKKLNEIAGISITNGRARKREHEKQNEKLDTIDANVIKTRKSIVKAAVAAGVAGILATSIFGGAILYKIDKADEKEANAYKSYAALEQMQYDDIKSLLEKMGVDGLSEEEINQLNEKRDAYAQNDNPILGMSSTPAIDALIENAINKQSFAALKNQYDEILNKYNQLLTNQSSPYDYAEFLTQLEGITKMLGTSLSDGTLSKEEKTSITKELSVLQNIKDDFGKQIATKFGKDIEDIMNSYEYVVASVSDEVASLKEEVKTLKDKALLDANTIAEKEAKISNLENQINVLKKQLANAGSDAELQSELAQAKADLQQAKTELAQAKADLENAKNDLAGLRDDYQSLVTENDELRSQLSGLRNEVSSLTQQVSSLTSENTGLKADNNTLSSQVSEYISKVAELNNKYDQLLASYNTKVAEYNNLYSRYEELVNSGSSSNTEEIARLQAALSQKEQELTTARNEINSLNGELDVLEQKVTDLTNQLSSNDSAFIKSLYEQLTGKSAEGKSIAEIKTYLEDAFGIESGNTNTGAAGDEGYAPER